MLLLVFLLINEIGFAALHLPAVVDQWIYWRRQQFVDAQYQTQWAQLRAIAVLEDLEWTLMNVETYDAPSPGLGPS